MTVPELTLAVLALLLTPGPTNSLMLLAGAERGLTGAARLIPTELAGYFLTVLPLALAGTTVLADHQGFRSGLTLAAAVWVGCLPVGFVCRSRERVGALARPQQRVAVEAVASLLGHESSRMTRQSYIRPGTVEQAEREQTQRVLAGSTLSQSLGQG